MPYFAAALVRSGDSWTGQELDLDDVEDLDGVADLLRDLVDEGTGPAVLFLEEDDEYFLVVRVDAAAEEPRTFISDVRAVDTSELAARLYDESATEVIVEDEEEDDAAEDDEDDTASRLDAEPGGDDAIVSDLGTPAGQLRRLCAEEGMLPADVIYAICERAGAAEQLEELRGA